MKATQTPTGEKDIDGLIYKHRLISASSLNQFYKAFLKDSEFYIEDNLSACNGFDDIQIICTM